MISEYKSPKLFITPTNYKTMKNYFQLLLMLFVTISSALSQTISSKDSIIYACPPCHRDCDTIQFRKAGICPYCGMKLIAMSINNFEHKDISICFYLQDGIEILDFAGPLEVFDAAGFKIFIVSKTKEKILSQGLLAIVPEYSIADAPKSDITAFFGGETSVPTNDPELISWIQSGKKSTDYFFSVCTGAFILGKAGILDNLTATTYHDLIGALQEALPKTKVLANERFVDNANVITTAGVSAGIDGALHLVEKLKGRDFAKNVAERIEYDKWVPDRGLIIKNN